MKTNLITSTTPLLAGAILTLLGQPETGRTQGLFSTVEATIRDTPTYFYTDWDETSLGYLMVKYGTSANAAKSYFKFDFTGQSPNTNANLLLRFTAAANSQRQHVQVWALNQPYPTMAANMVWAYAQANITNVNNNDLHTAPPAPYTATRVVDAVVGSGTGARTITLPAPWGPYMQGKELVLVLTGFNNPATNQANGLRIGPGSAYLEFPQVFLGTPPTVGPIANLVVYAGQTSATNSFTVNDAEDGPDLLQPVAASSNPAVVSAANVFFGGSGSTRTVYVLGSAPGTAQITVTVTDADGNAGQRTFTVTVEPSNFPPEISGIGLTNTYRNTPITVPFVVSDAETPATNLTVWVSIAEYSSNVLATATPGGSGSNRTVTVTPVSNADGVGVVNLAVVDEHSNTTRVSFAVMVLPATNVVFLDRFDYPPGRLFDYAGGLWVRRNAAAQSVGLNTALDFNGNGVAYIRPSSTADDGAARLVGATYTLGSGVLLYTFCKAQWIDVGGALPTNSNRGFVHLANNATGTTPLMSELCTVQGVPDSTFLLGIWSAAGSAVPFPHEVIGLPAPVTPVYDIAMRYDVDTQVATLWVNGTNEASPSVSAVAASPWNVSFVGLRQDTGHGHVYVDELKVVAVRKPRLAAIAVPTPGTVEILFAGGPGDVPADFVVQRAATVTGTYQDISATIAAEPDHHFRATVSAGGSPQGFYRIRRQPLTF